MSAFDKLVDHAIRYAKKTMHRHGELVATWFIRDRNGDLLVHKTPWNGPGHKRMVVLSMRFLLSAIEAQSFVMICESWLAPMRDEAELEQHQRSGASLEDHAKRGEAVIVVGEDRSGEMFNGFMEFFRDGRGFRWADMTTADEVESIFAGMINPMGRVQ